jgi:hypothetical protein
VTPRPSKVCATCGRTFAWRRRWAACWDEVRYCSDRCRGAKPRAEDPVEAVILDLLARRAPGATICPSEAARALAPDAWRERLPAVRDAARRLVRADRLRIVQGGVVVDPDDARGPIRLRLPDARSPDLSR